MAYLLINNENIAIDKIGENIFLRNFPPKYSQKANIIGKSKFNEYSACLDPTNRIHLVYKTSNNSIIHVTNIGTSYTTKTLLEDLDDIYKICNISILSHKENYLFYSARNPYENTNDLIFHRFSDTNESSPQALLSLPKLTSKYQCILANDNIYVLCCLLNKEQYELNLYRYNITANEWEGYDSLVISEYPITNYSFVIKESEVHITYVIEKFGHSSLYYGQRKKDNFLSKEITSIGKSINPILFIYNGVIWINYLVDNKAYYSFSCNGGETFTQPSSCTLQHNSLDIINLSTYNKTGLYGTQFLGYIDHNPNIAILSQIDIDKILVNSTTNKEMKEMLMTVVGAKGNANQSNSQTQKLIEENQQLKEMQEKIVNQYNELMNFTKEVQAEGKKWRKKYNKLNREIKRQNLKNPSTESTSSETI